MAEAGAEILHKELSYRIVGCAQTVHSKLGPGFPEAVYHKALCYELIDACIAFETEKTVEVFYNDKPCGEFRLDLFVAGEVVVELKALASLNSEHVSQALSYLKVTGCDLAILLNFGRKSLETKRVVE